MSRLAASAAAACLCLLLACAESGPATVRIFGLDPQANRYQQFDARLQGVGDVVAMRGETVRFVAGATIKGDLLASASDPKSADILRPRGGAAPTCSFSEHGGVLHADDYDSMNMASSYWALERARDLFIDLGVEAEGLNPLHAYYHPRIEMLIKVVPTYFLLIDNAAYAPTFDGFLILPHATLDAVPFSMNLGVMAHEYSHKVTNRLMHRGAKVPAFVLHDWEEAATNQLRGVDEGLADIYAHLLTLDPNFIQPSVEGMGVTLDRDLTKVRVDNPKMVDQWLGLAGEAIFGPHELGAHVAGALWQLGEGLADHRRVARLLLDVQRELAEDFALEPKYDFSTLGFFDKVAARLLGEERLRWCAIVKARFPTLIAADIRHPMELCQ